MAGGLPDRVGPRLEGGRVTRDMGRQPLSHCVHPPAGGQQDGGSHWGWREGCTGGRGWRKPKGVKGRGQAFKTRGALSPGKADSPSLPQERIKTEFMEILNRVC